MFFWCCGIREIVVVSFLGPVETCTSRIYLYNGISNAPNGDHMQNLRPQGVGISTTPIGAHKSFGVSSPRVRVLDVKGFLIYSLNFKKAFRSSL
jgi:hypothetical protein